MRSRANTWDFIVPAGIWAIVQGFGPTEARDGLLKQCKNVSYIIHCYDEYQSFDCDSDEDIKC